MELGFVPHALGAVTPGGAAVLAQVPCYSQDLEDCINRINSNQPPGTPQCSKWRELKEADLKAWNNAIDNMPYCPQPAESSTASHLGLGFVIGAVVVGGAVALLLA